MASYYYLISSLPNISSTGEMPMSYEEFLDCCESNVSASTYKLLSELTLASEEGPLLKEWAQAYGSLMNELNYQRSQNLGKPFSASYEKDALGAQVANAAMKAENPLKAEKVLLDYEFDLLDSLVGMHTFDDHVLFGYALKLKLLERQDCFEQDKGKAEFKSLFDQVQQRVYSL